jgi:hypothetical protein
MDWTPLSLRTFFPQLPKVINDNFQATEDLINIFYDQSGQILVKPVFTTGRVKGATGEFVNVITDNLTVKSQFTNLYSNYTIVDSDFVTYFNGNVVSTRLATSDPSSTSYIDASTTVWPLEPSAYTWVDVQTPYIKINNDASYGFQNNQTGLEFRLLFNLDVSTTNPYTILVDSSEGGQQNLVIDYTDAASTWIKLITTSYDASYGPTWTIKEYAGSYTLS